MSRGIKKTNVRGERFEDEENHLGDTIIDKGTHFEFKDLGDFLITCDNRLSKNGKPVSREDIDSIKSFRGEF
jgi:hypothetical protein